MVSGVRRVRGPQKIHHKPGPDFAVKITSKEVEEGMVRMVEAFRKDPAQAKRLVIHFIREYNPPHPSEEDRDYGDAAQAGAHNTRLRDE